MLQYCIIFLEHWVFWSEILQRCIIFAPIGFLFAQRPKILHNCNITLLGE